MVETNEKLILAGFDLEPAERAIADNLIKSHVHKIASRADYDYITLNLKKTQKGKNTLHDVRGSLKSGKLLLKSTATDYNLYAALAEVLENLLKELEHKLRTNRQ